ncbi:MAG: hypothetical protein QXF45_04625 [Candidatus Caldarchaeum sp.]
MSKRVTEIFEENALDYLHSVSKIVLTTEIPTLSFAGKNFEDLKRGVVLNVWNWVADVLVSHGFAEYVSKPSLSTQLMQVEWREKTNPSDLQPLPKHFYAEMSRSADDEYIQKRLLDVATMRMMKVMMLAAKRLEGDVLRKLTPEEEALYRLVFKVVDEWMRAVGSKKG